MPSFPKKTRCMADGGAVATGRMTEAVDDYNFNLNMAEGGSGNRGGDGRGFRPEISERRTELKRRADRAMEQGGRESMRMVDRDMAKKGKK